MRLRLHDGAVAVCRLSADAPVPDWVELDGAPMASVTRTATELSLIVADDAVPDDVAAERGWRVLEVEGPLAFSETGVLAALAAPLADAGVPIFVVSTYDTDWLLVRATTLDKALSVLGAAGHEVER